MIDHGSLAEQLYEAYGEDANWLNFMQTRMPAWADLPEKIQDHWTRVAIRAAELLL